MNRMHTAEDIRQLEISLCLLLPPRLCRRNNVGSYDPLHDP